MSKTERIPYGPNVRTFCWQCNQVARHVNTCNSRTTSKFRPFECFLHPEKVFNLSPWSRNQRGGSDAVRWTSRLCRLATQTATFKGSSIWINALERTAPLPLASVAVWEYFISKWLYWNTYIQVIHWLYQKSNKNT